MEAACIHGTIICERLVMICGLCYVIIHRSNMHKFYEWLQNIMVLVLQDAILGNQLSNDKITGLSYAQAVGLIHLYTISGLVTTMLKSLSKTSRYQNNLRQNPLRSRNAEDRVLMRLLQSRQGLLYSRNTRDKVLMQVMLS